MKQRLNNFDRTQWIDNDEGLYNWWLSSGLPKGKFIKQNKQELDECILKMINHEKPYHYLAYGRDKKR